MTNCVTKNQNALCCKSKGIQTRESETGLLVSFSNKEKPRATKAASDESLHLSTESGRLSRKKENKSKRIDENDNPKVDHRPAGLMHYQRQIERKCNDNCPTKRNFTYEIASNLCEAQTLNKVDLAAIVYLKAVYPNAPCPYAIDSESYSVFQDFFHPLIRDLQNGVEPVDSSIGLTFGILDTYENLDLNDDKDVLRVMYCEIIVRRNLNEYNLNGCLKADQKIMVKDFLKAKCKELFSSMSPVTIPDEWVQRLQIDEPYLCESRGMNDYPKGRLNMIYKDHLDCCIGSIINYDDHLQIVLSTNNGKLGHIFNQTNKILNSTILHKVEFMKHQKYGYITYSPQYLGTGFTIRLILRLYFICLMDDVEELYLKDLGLSLTHVDVAEKGLIILSNKQTLGITELNIFLNILEGYKRLYDLDMELKNTSPNAIIDKTMPVESLATLIGRIHNSENSRTYTKKYLTDIIAHQYENTLTLFNGLFNHCIRANAFYPKSLFPKACDPDCYSLFSRFFNPIILEANHCRQFLHSATPNYGIASHDSRYKFQHDLVKGYRVRFSRNFEEYPFPMLMTTQERKEIENKMINVFHKLPKDFVGTYYKLENINEAPEFNFLQDLHLIPKPNNSIKRASWVYRDWPTNRGIFLIRKDINHPKTILLVLVNEMDHFQVSSINIGGQRLDYCYDRAVKIMQILDVFLHNAYARKPNYGFLSSNPQNIGCSMRVGARIYLRHLGEDRAMLNEFCILNSMNYRGQYGSGTSIIDNTFDMSLKLNLNYSEIQVLLIFIQRLKDLILEERTYDHTIVRPMNFREHIDVSPENSKVTQSESTSGYTESSTILTDDSLNHITSIIKKSENVKSSSYKYSTKDTSSKFDEN